MAFLAPLAATGAGAAGTAAALGTGAAAAGAGTALGTGLTAGSILGTGAATSGVLGGLGLNALGGMTSILPASAGLTAAAPALAAPVLASQGLVAAAPAAGIFAKATPALAGLPSVTPVAPGIFSQAAPALGGLQSLATPTASSLSSAALQTAKGNIIQNAMANQAVQNAAAQNLASSQLASSQLASPVSLTSKFGLETAGVRPGLKFPTELYGGQVTPDMAFKTMGDGASGLLPQTAQTTQLATRAASPIVKGENFISNLGNLVKNPSMQGVKDYAEEHPFATSAAVGLGAQSLLGGKKAPPPEQNKGMIRPYTFDYNPNAEAYAVSPAAGSQEQEYFEPTFTAQEPYKAASGGIASAYAVGGPVETMAAMNAVGANTGYPMAGINTAMYSNPMVQRPEAVNVISPSGDAGVTAYSGEPKFAAGGISRIAKRIIGEKDSSPTYTYDPKTLQFTQTAGPGGTKTTGGVGATVGRQGAAPAATTPAQQTQATAPAYQTPEQQLGLTDFYAMMDRRLSQMGGYAAGGGVSHLGDYSDGGRLLKGPGDGVSDSIPAVIGKRQPARLADGEFVIPARIVSELGNGSTEAGARKLYAMMDRIQKGRRKSVGRGKVAVDSKSDKHLPA